MHIPVENGYIKNTENHDRFAMPKDIIRISAGPGGDGYLILGSEKTVLYDCGMACFAKLLIENLHEVLDPPGRKIDIIVLSHTHYDHIGALPYVLEEYPDAIVMGAEKAGKVFSSEAALSTMENLGEKARLMYGMEDIVISAKGMHLDKEVHEGDIIDIGDKYIICYETPGHTLCAMMYGLHYKEHPGEEVLFVNETLGVYLGLGTVEVAALKGYDLTISQARRLKKLGYSRLIMQHYGVMEPENVPLFFDQYIKAAEEERDFIKKWIEEGLDDEQVLEKHKEIWWTKERNYNQPFEAYKVNTLVVIKLMRKELSR